MAFDYSVKFKAVDNISKKIDAINSKIDTMEAKAKQASNRIKLKADVAALKMSKGFEKSTARMTKSLSNLKVNPKVDIKEPEILGKLRSKAKKQLDGIKQDADKLKLEPELKLNTSKALSKLKKFQAKTEEIGSKGKATFQSGLGNIAAGTGALATLAIPIKTAQDFEARMLGVKSIISGTYGTTQEEVKRLNDDYLKMTDKAKQLGSETAWSASQVAGGMKFMSMAGFDASKTIQAMPGVLSLATVGEMDLSRASDIASNTLSGFGIEASKMNKVSDMMAKTITTSNTTIESLGESFKYVAPISSGLGISMAETSAMVGRLGDAGINGTVAGNALKRMMLNLSAPTERVSQALDELRINTFDTEGRFKPMAEQIGMIKSKIKDMPQASKVAYLKDIFGAIALPSALVLMEKGQKGIEDYTKALEGSEGVAKRVADIQLSGSEGKLKLLKSAFEGLNIAIGSNFLGNISELYQHMTDIIVTTQKWVLENKELVSKIGMVVASIGAFLLTMGLLKVTIGLIGMSIGVLGSLLTIITGKFGLWNILTWRTAAGNHWLAISFGILKKGILSAGKAVVWFAKTVLFGFAQATWSILKFVGKTTVAMFKWAIDQIIIMGSALKSVIITMAGYMFWGAVGFISWAGSSVLAAKMFIASMIPALIEGTVAVWGFTSALLANPITWIVVAVIALVASVVLLIVYFEEIVDWIQKVWESFGGLAAIMRVVKNVADFILNPFSAVITLVKDAVEWIDKFLSKFEIFVKAKEKIGAAWNYLFGDDEELAGGGSGEINTTNKNESTLNVNVTTSDGAQVETKTQSTGQVKLNTVTNGI